MSRPFLRVAIDGPAASGKSSTAKAVAQALDIRHVDSGAFYRAIAAVALQSGQPPEQWTETDVLDGAPRVGRTLTAQSVAPTIDGALADELLRSDAVTAQVSRVARMHGVREWVNRQIRLAGSESDVVVDGRDIGTVVFPDAQVKVQLVAELRERARRRLLQRSGVEPSEAVLDAECAVLAQRDDRDAPQSIPHPDAATIDTTRLTQTEQIARIIELARPFLTEVP
jgi:cytidylate kinase